MSTPVTAKEKTNKKNDVKARCLLLMALLNEHQLTFSQYPYAKFMFGAIETRFRGDAAIKKTLLKQTLTNLSGILMEVVLEKKSLSVASPSVNTVSPQVCTASVNDNIVYACMVKNPNGSNVLHQDLKQIHEDDLEAMDLKWQLSLRRSAEHQEARRKNKFDKHGSNAFSDSEVYTDKTCSKTCLKNYETLKKQYDDLLAKQHQTEFKAITYKRGLDTVEAQLVTYRKNEVLFSEEVVVLKREVGVKQYEINMLKTDKKGFGYSAVPPPHPLIYNRPNKLDLSYSGLDEFKEPEFKGYGPKNNKKESNVVCDKESKNSKDNSVNEVEPKKVRKNNDAPIIEDWVSDDEEQDESKTKPESKTIIPTADKIEKTSIKKSLGQLQLDDKGLVLKSWISRHMTVT
ncbi:hypothetical protein Tco_1090116 [Tanacetum coccineum]|uniref:Uncharacterized protein n=1 Tax=Tanacetum coccineum TaxID=301880 RepID=A0ABQ5I5D4_9ASTR